MPNRKRGPGDRPVNVAVPGTSVPREPDPGPAEHPDGRTTLGEGGIDSASINAFFRDLIEFLREFTSVPPEERAKGPAPRKANRAGARSEPDGQTSANPRLPRKADSPAPVVAPAAAEAAAAAPVGVPAAEAAAEAPETARRSAPARTAAPSDSKAAKAAKAAEAAGAAEAAEAAPAAAPNARSKPPRRAAPSASNDSGENSPVRVPPFVAKM